MIDEKDFLPQLRAAMKPTWAGFAVDEAFVRDVLSGLGSPPSQVLTGKPAARNNGDLPYEEIGWDGTPATLALRGCQLVDGDIAEMAVSMFSVFFSEVGSRRYVEDHDIFEFRIYPEIAVTHHARRMQFYARLVSYTSLQAMQATHARTAKLIHAREAV